jgi:hypothetical protein
MTHSFKAGDRIKLKWHGDAALPQTLAYTEATVLKVHRVRLVVKADQDAYGERKIDPGRHVYAILREGKWVRL